ncbi:hypothetical protein, partial [Edaphobacter aggregans]|uniref:hypothetical protein n=1 Tax=Edaphobacter aggregans TaxID=570835 RepID=UPI003CCB9EED
LTALSAQGRIAFRIGYSLGTPDRQGGKMLTGINLIALLSDRLSAWSDEYSKKDPLPHYGSAATLLCASCRR